MCSDMDKRKLNTVANKEAENVGEPISAPGDADEVDDVATASTSNEESAMDSKDDANSVLVSPEESSSEGEGAVEGERLASKEVAVDEVRLEKSEEDDSEKADEEKPALSQNSSSKKKRAGMLAAAACLALLVIILTSQALSFLVREYPAKGSIKFDGVDIELILTTHDVAGEEVPAVDGEEIPTGEVHVDRTVYAKNTGPQPVWVRVKLGFAMNTQEGERDISDLCTFAGGSSSWIKGGEWFYLDAPLGPGDTSPALITALTVDSQSAQDRHGSGGYKLTAQAGAVQSKHNAATVLDVEGWPE